jgi:hypothetical protein
MLCLLCSFAYISERCSGISKLTQILMLLGNHDADVSRTIAVV